MLHGDYVERFLGRLLKCTTPGKCIGRVAIDEIGQLAGGTRLIDEQENHDVPVSID